MATRKPYKVMDRTRSVKKGVMASSLEDFVLSSRRKLSYSGDREIYVVLEEDGTEVDDDDYFQTLEPNTCLMLLYSGERWSPFSAPSDVRQKKPKKVLPQWILDAGKPKAETAESEKKMEVSEIERLRKEVRDAERRGSIVEEKKLKKVLKEKIMKKLSKF